MVLTKRHFETINNSGFTWTDIQKPTRDNISTLGTQYPFHELNLDDSLSKIHIPKVDKYKDHLFILLNFPVNMREKKHEYDIPKVSQLSIFVGINYLITIHQSEIEPLVEMFQLCKSNEKECETSMGDSPGFLLHNILEALVSDLFHRLSKIGISRRLCTWRLRFNNRSSYRKTISSDCTTRNKRRKNCSTQRHLYY